MASACRNRSSPRRPSSRRCVSRSRMSNDPPAGGPSPARGVTVAPDQASASGRGLLFIVSAPSGAGKTTVVEQLVEQVPHLRMSRSYTSRLARAGESDGVDYNFVTRQRFETMIAEGEFLEWADVFGNLYGTCAAATERMLAAGDDVVLVIDVQGARKVRSRQLAAATVF